MMRRPFVLMLFVLCMAIIGLTIAWISMMSREEHVVQDISVDALTEDAIGITYEAFGGEYKTTDPSEIVALGQALRAAEQDVMYVPVRPDVGRLRRFVLIKEDGDKIELCVIAETHWFYYDTSACLSVEFRGKTLGTFCDAFLGARRSDVLSSESEDG